MSLLSEDITNIVVDTVLGIRKGIGKARYKEHSEYVKNLIKAKEGNVDPGVMPDLMVMDRVEMGVGAVLSKRVNSGMEGGLSWEIIELKGKRDSETQTGAKVDVNLTFESTGEVRVERYQELSVDELKKVAEIIELDS
jgi:hypothetical protein